VKRDFAAHVAGCLLALALHALIAWARFGDDAADDAARAYAARHMSLTESSADAPAP
jgi:hypothetical protein